MASGGTATDTRTCDIHLLSILLNPSSRVRSFVAGNQVLIKELCRQGRSFMYKGKFNVRSVPPKLNVIVLIDSWSHELHRQKCSDYRPNSIPKTRIAGMRTCKRLSMARRWKALRTSVSCLECIEVTQVQNRKFSSDIRRPVLLLSSQLKGNMARSAYTMIEISINRLSDGPGE